MSANGQPTLSEEEPPAPKAARNGRKRLLVSLLGPLLVLAVLGFLAERDGASVDKAISRVHLGALALATAIVLVTLVARTEAVVECLAAIGDRPLRRDIHAANGLTFLAAAINHYISAPVRAALLKRIDPERSPTIMQMVMVDTATAIVEGLLVLVLIVVSAGTLKLSWLATVGIVVAAVAGVGVVMVIRKRFASSAAFRGFDVLVHSRRRLHVAGLMVIVIGGNVARTMLLLSAVGLHPTLVQATATFVAAGVLSSLFAGPTAGTAGAPLIIFGSRGLATAGAAGLVLAVPGLMAAGLYALAVLPLYARTLRRNV